LIFVSANTNHCEELIYPKEFMADTIPPVITDISVINLVNKSAKVTWKTDEFADSVLKYGVNSTAYTETCLDVLFVKEHEIALTELSPDTTYYFVVNSTDQSGNSAESSEYRFKYDW
jgi:chitodextrinase